MVQGKVAEATEELAVKVPSEENHISQKQGGPPRAGSGLWEVQSPRLDFRAQQPVFWFIPLPVMRSERHDPVSDVTVS